MPCSLWFISLDFCGFGFHPWIWIWGDRLCLAWTLPAGGGPLIGWWSVSGCCSEPCRFSPAWLPCVSSSDPHLLARLGALEDRVDRLGSQVEDLTAALTSLRLDLRASASRGEGNSHRAEETSVVSFATSSVGSNGDYNSLAREIPVVSDEALRLCALLSSTPVPARERASRAWEIGFWARFCLEERVRTPRPSPPLDIKNSVYVVLRAPGFDCPLWVQRAADYRVIVGDFTADTLSHGFPSQAEAKVYCLGAGVQWPLHPYQRR